MSFIAHLHAQLRTLGDRPVVIERHAHGPVEIPGTRLLDLAARARTVLADHGVTPGDRVVLLGPNSARWVAADLAILGHGAVSVPMYARQDPAELVAMMHDCQAKVVLVADRALAEGVLEHWADAPVVVFDALFAAQASPAPLVERGGDDVATLVYTSGTSGEPKGVQLTVANVGHMLPCTSDALTELMGASPGRDRVFHYLPFCFAGSRIVLWTALFRANPIHVSMDLDRLIDEIGETGPHYFLNVPVLLERVKNGAEAALKGKGAAVWWLYQRARTAFARRLDGTAGRRDRLALAVARRLLLAPIKAKLGPDLRFLICGSAPLGEDTQRWFEMLGVPVYQVYGLTETTAIVTMDQPGRVEPGRVGFAIPGCELKLGEQDELLVRGPHIFSGYHGRPEATAAAFEDGWFRTGDQVRLREDGSLAVIGRVKNLLVPTSGHNVAPEPIETKLTAAIPGVEQAVLIGHARPHLTVILTGDADPADIEAGLAWVNAELPHYRRVRAHHLRREPLTDAEGLLTANGKLKRAAIEAHFADAIDALYA